MVDHVSACHLSSLPQADTNNHALRRVNISSGFVITIAGSPVQGTGHTDGAGTAATFFNPVVVAMDAIGSFAVVVSRLSSDQGSRRSHSSSYVLSGNRLLSFLMRRSHIESGFFRARANDALRFLSAFGMLLSAALGT